VATARRTDLRENRFLGLFVFVVRLRLIFAFFAFRFLAMQLPPLIPFQAGPRPEYSQADELFC
jgi:hypothetical protein